MTDGQNFPVTFIRKPLQLRAMQWTGDNEDAIQTELAGQGFREVTLCTDPEHKHHPEQTAEVRNDFYDAWEGVEEGWWVCLDPHGRLFATSGAILEANYDQA